MTKKSLYQGHLTTIVLKLLADNDEMYGYQITRMVKEISSGEVQLTEGALYPILHKLEANGLVEVRHEKTNNRTRKYYKLTQNGYHETTHLLKEMQDFLKQMEVLISPIPKLK